VKIIGLRLGGEPAHAHVVDHALAQWADAGSVEVMMELRLENEADCLIRQHREPRHGPLTNRRRLPEPLA
jgi:hypothetical protein